MTCAETTPKPSCGVPPRRDPRYVEGMLVDPNNPFFNALWVRLLCVLAPLAWALVELSSGSVFWAILFGAAGLYLGYALFVQRGR